MIKWQLLTPEATVPTRGSEDAAGFDLYSTVPRRLHPGQRQVIPTGLKCSMPAGYVGLIWPRSGMAVKHGADVLAGVVDADYRGEVMVALVNHGERNIDISPGDRVAQMLVQTVALDSEVVPDLDETGRGDGGFGSTGS